MTEVQTAISLTSASVEKMSRHELLAWVNNNINGQHKKIEELCSGVAYCQMMERISPNCIGLKKLKINAKFDHEYIQNFRLLQSAFNRLNFDKQIPIEKLIKGRFQDNLEFLQWFKKFYTLYSVGKENAKLPLTPVTTNQTCMKGIKPLAGGDAQNKTAVVAPNALRTPKNKRMSDETRTCSPSNLKVLEEEKNELSEQINVVDYERDYYFRKLQAIETLIKESQDRNEHTDWCTRALEVIYMQEEFH